MRLRFVLTITLLTVCMCVADAAPKTPREQLIGRLKKIVKTGYMYGHQDDPFYGISWDWDMDRSDTKELVGDYPAVMGFDLGGIEMGDAKNLDSVPFQRMHDEIVRHHERGGIITISWHPRNPMIGTTAWIEKDIEEYEKAMVKFKEAGLESLGKQIDPRLTVRSILKGGRKYDRFQQWLGRVADFMKSLTDQKGNPIPVIFRPWHENNGSWFWWGQKNCSDEEYHELWNMTQDYINSQLPTSIVWSFSPNLQGNWTEEEWMKRYPGDDRVDLIGEDAYQWGTEADFKRQLDADLQLLTQICEKHDKLLAMTECGYQNSPDATWWQRVFKPIIEKYKIAYFLPWRNYKKEHFGASKEANTADDFKAWSKQKNFLFLNDIKKVK